MQRCCNLVAVGAADVDHPAALHAGFPDHVLQRERACLVRNDEVDILPGPSGFRQQLVDELRKVLVRDTEEVLAVHVKHGMPGEGLSVLVKIEPSAPAPISHAA